MKRTAAIALIVALAVGVAALIVFASPKFSKGSVYYSAQNDLGLAFTLRPGAHLPLGTTLVDEAGRAVVLRDYFTKAPAILVFEYLRCTSLCGVTLRNLTIGLAHLPLEPGRDYQLVAVSIDSRDRPADAAAARAKYAGLLGRGSSGFHFLTGAPAAVGALAETVGLHYRYDALLDAYIHPAGFVVAAPDGLVSRYVEGVAVTPEQLAGALADAEQDKSPGLLTRIVLFCHVQGVALGRLTAPVMAALMIANIAAGLALIALFAAIRRRG